MEDITELIDLLKEQGGSGWKANHLQESRSMPMLPSECHSDNLIADINTIGHSCSKGDLGSYGIVTNRVFDPIGQGETTAKSNELGLENILSCNIIDSLPLTKGEKKWDNHVECQHRTDESILDLLKDSVEQESRNGDSGESEAMCSLPAKNMEKAKEKSKLSSVHLSLEWDGGHMKLVPLSGDNLERLDSSREFWKVTCKFGEKLIRERAVSVVYGGGGFVPLGRSCFSRPLHLRTSMVPFAVSTESPDQTCHSTQDCQQGSASSGGRSECLFFGKVDLTHSTASPVYDYTPPPKDHRSIHSKIHWHTLKVKTFQFTEHVRDMCWTHPPGVDDHTHFLLAAAGLNISVISWNVEREAFHPILHNFKVQDNAIRSVTSNGQFVAFGGYSRCIDIHELSRLCGAPTGQEGPTPLMRCFVGDVISCVTTMDEYGICCSTDCGRVVWFDSRVGHLPVMDYVSNKRGLYCHSLVKTVPCNALLGFAGGIVEQVDFRYPLKPILRLQDGRVSDVSDIHLSEDDSRVLVLGVGGFSLYKRTRSSSYSLKCFGGQRESPLSTDYTVAGNFIPDTKLYGLADSHGFLVVGEQ